MHPMKLLHLFALATPFSLMAATEPGIKLIRIEHRMQIIEGWTVHVDTSLLEG